MSDGPHHFGVPAWFISDIDSERDPLALIYAARDILAGHAMWLREHRSLQTRAIQEASADRMALLERIVARLRIVLSEPGPGEWGIADSVHRRAKNERGSRGGIAL